ncbi:MAG: carboxypeptidase-like regulatory domain-containing protein, partial [Gemmatimonadota bacterium]|nr:carboxypeptidase-like regulatory domain-containing protein [Gemmatimonadota bacterium]
MNTKLLTANTLTLVISLMTAGTGYGLAAISPGADEHRSVISGYVTDTETKAPLDGASVVISGTKTGSNTDSRGHFTISGVPVGSYSLQFSYTGYEPLTKTDIIVKSNRNTFVSAEMRMTVIEIEGITVDAGYFSHTAEEPVSTVNFSAEEIRRAPGSAGDVSRIVSTLPSIAKVNDRINGLVVRGGNPVENAFYLDNMEIPNINHFPMEGTSAGPIGLLNVDFIQ